LIIPKFQELCAIFKTIEIFICQTLRWILHMDAPNNSITILKLNPRFSSGNCTSMVKVLSLNQKRYFLCISGSSRFFAISTILFCLLSFSFSFLLRFLPVSFSFPLTFFRFFSRKSEDKYFGHVVPIVLSQMPELASYALCAPLWVIFCYLILSRCSVRVRASSLFARFVPMPGVVSFISRGRRLGSSSPAVLASSATSSDPPTSKSHSWWCRQRHNHPPSTIHSKSKRR